MIIPGSERALLAACFDSRTETLAPHDWEGLIRTAAAEVLLPGLYRRLCEIRVEIPPEISDFLAAVEDMNRERNERVLDEAQSIAMLLNGIDIEPVFLKGAAYLVEGVYPALGCRYLCDLDLLIPASRLEAATEALQHEGYRPDTLDAMARFRHHYPQLQRPIAADSPGDGSGSSPVELHHSLGMGVVRKLLSAEEVLRDSRLVEWRGVRARVPSPEHLVTHLIVHSQIHHSYRERIWPPLRAMWDLVLLSRFLGDRIEWASIRERFRAHGEESTLLLHLLQVEKTMGMPAPCAIQPGWMARARWKRRQALNWWPGLRFIDPVYLVLSTLSRRMRFLKSVVLAPEGWKHAARMLFRRGFYRRLLSEISLR